MALQCRRQSERKLDDLGEATVVTTWTACCGLLGEF